MVECLNNNTPTHNRKRTAETEENIMTSDSDEQQENAAVSLEGTLLVRKGRATGNSSWKWKRRFVVFRFEKEGSLAIYKQAPPNSKAQSSSSVLRTVYSKLHRKKSTMDVFSDDELDDEKNTPLLNITADLPWVVKDIPHDPSTFVLEIEMGEDLQSADDNRSFDELSMDQSADLDDTHNTFDEYDLFSVDGEGIETTLDAIPGDLVQELENARNVGKPFRLYLQCHLDPNEKALWLKAFSNAGRLSKGVRKKMNLLRSLSTFRRASRVRNKATARIAKDARQLDFSGSGDIRGTSYVDPTKDVEFLVRGNRHSIDKEFRVQPTYAYPHRWMTKPEMREEMILPSDHVHDLRIPTCQQKEIGSLEIEVLQCIGLPRLDRGSDSDAVVYMVCGSYAFSTDIIYSRANPMWLRKSRRACEFPLFEGYARLYVGVFDDEPRKVKDDFAGRVVIDLARLRPQSTYDVTLPLRLSTHVYSRRRRGSIRLRFTLNWRTERAALLSYIPRTLKIPLPQHSKPNLSTTVMCSDQKAFRNIAITVHGAHLPGRFTFTQLRAVIREINFTRKYVFSNILRTIQETRRWQNPAISAFVFLSWMHCVYADSFSLVPAYVMLSIMLLLTQNYARYCVDGPSQRGFVPPSWEEMFMALVRGGDANFRAIEPLDLTVDHAAMRKQQRRATSLTHIAPPLKVKTHEPKGKKLFEALGFFTESEDANQDHLEFPFADGKIYPKFTVRESLVSHCRPAEGTPDTQTIGVTYQGPPGSDAENKSRFNLDVDWMKKDISGTKEFDEEESKFRAGRAVISKGRKAASRVTRTATAITSKTGLDHVIEPIQSGITNGVAQVSSGVAQVSSGVARGAANKMSVASSHVKSFRRQSKQWGSGGLEVFETSQDDLSTFEQYRMRREERPGLRSPAYSFDSDIEGFLSEDDIIDYGQSSEEDLLDAFPGAFATEQEEPPPDAPVHPLDRSDGTKSVVPDQDIDIQGPSTGKKLTEDLEEARDKMHELTWHLFNDHTYTLKNRNPLFFDESKKPEKWRKANTSKLLDRYLHMGKYSHSNPFVARVGTYVQPIVSSIYGILCLFRALFNVVTWRDPFFTFLISFACGLSSIILFFFPWRIFLFFVGCFVVGPQNWAIRILREQGHLPHINRNMGKGNDDDSVWDHVPDHLPLFTAERRRAGNEPKLSSDPAADPREVHHVVVPYSPLIYQRCNDWPPEPEYASVKRSLDRKGPRGIKGCMPIRKGSSFDAEMNTATSVTSNRIVRFRKRLQNRKK